MEIYEATEVTDEVVAAFQQLVPQLSTSARIPNKDEIAEIVNSPATILYLARDPDRENQIVGSLTLVLFRIPTGVRAWIEDVIVDQASRGKGIGEALTLAALDRSKKAGAKTVDLTSRPSREAANRLYQRIGFQQRETNLYRYDFLKNK